MATLTASSLKMGLINRKLQTMCSTSSPIFQHTQCVPIGWAHAAPACSSTCRHLPGQQRVLVQPLLCLPSHIFLFFHLLPRQLSTSKYEFFNLLFIRFGSRLQKPYLLNLFSRLSGH